MTGRLSIRNFGPIRQADLEIRDLTILVGPQATGKSMAAQLIYLSRGLEELLPLSMGASARKAPGSYNPKFDTPAARNIISCAEWWLGNHASVYARPGSIVSWMPSISAADMSYDIRWEDEKVSLNYYLESWMDEPGRPRYDEKPDNIPVYIPAGRALYSYLPLGLVLPLLTGNQNRPEWPGYIFRFYQILESTIKSMWEFQEQPNETFPDGELSLFIQQRIQKVLKGEVRYGPNAILLKTGGQTLRPDTIAAGQMEAWPFFAILQNAILKGETEKLRIYFDEPEAHLHPGAQRIVMEIVAALVRSGAQVILTTHSPYILYALNNFLTAGEVLDKGRKLPPELPTEVALLPQQVAAYCFNSDGQARDIMDREVGLVDSNELNRVAEDLGSDFTAMQEQLLDGEE